jgi:hypothetical protein
VEISSGGGTTTLPLLQTEGEEAYPDNLKSTMTRWGIIAYADAQRQTYTEQDPGKRRVLLQNLTVNLQIV